MADSGAVAVMFESLLPLMVNFFCLSYLCGFLRLWLPLGPTVSGDYGSPMRL
jgi:hypothetical protein